MSRLKQSSHLPLKLKSESVQYFFLQWNGSIKCLLRSPVLVSKDCCLSSSDSRSPVLHARKHTSEISFSTEIRRDRLDKENMSWYYDLIEQCESKFVNLCVPVLPGYLTIGCSGFNPCNGKKKHNRNKECLYWVYCVGSNAHRQVFRPGVAPVFCKVWPNSPQIWPVTKKRDQCTKAYIGLFKRKGETFGQCCSVRNFKWNPTSKINHDIIQ